MIFCFAKINRNSKCLSYLGVFVSFAFIHIKIKEVSSSVSNNWNYGNYDSESPLSNKLASISEINKPITYTKNTLAPLKRFLWVESRDVLNIEKKIWLKGLPQSLPGNAKRAFESSTALSLIYSIILYDQGDIGTGFSLDVSVLEYGEGYVDCDFKITLHEISERPRKISLGATEDILQDLIWYSFLDESFKKNYLRLLNLSSKLFRNVIDVSLIEWTPVPSSFPTSPIHFQIHSIVLEFFGINELNRVHKQLLENRTEQFLLNSLNNDWRLYTDFEKVSVDLLYSDKIFVDKIELTLQATICVPNKHGKRGNPINNGKLQNILTSVFKNNHEVYLNEISTLRKNIYNFQVSILSPAPSLHPSVVPSGNPRESPTYEPTSYPSLLPSSLPISVSSPTPTYFPSNDLSFIFRVTPFYHHISHSSKNQNTLPSTEPTYNSLIPSQLISSLSRSNFPSTEPTYNNLFFFPPLEKSSPNFTMAPAPCIDDSSYISRYNMTCQIHSYTKCNKMGEAGFTLEEIDELKFRCKKSCNTCTLPKTHAIFVLKDNLELPSPPSSLPTSMPSSKIFYRQPSTNPTNLQLPKLICSNNPLYIDKLGLRCETYINIECSELRYIGFSEVEVHEVMSACAKSCIPECSDDNIEVLQNSKSKVYSNELASSCKDDYFYKSRYGLQCHQHMGIKCEKLIEIGFTEEDVKEIHDKCKLTCNNCLEVGENPAPLPVKIQVSPPEQNSKNVTIHNFDKLGNATITEANESHNITRYPGDDSIKVWANNAKVFMITSRDGFIIILISSIVGGSLVVFIVFGLFMTWKPNEEPDEIFTTENRSPNKKRAPVPFHSKVESATSTEGSRRFSDFDYDINETLTSIDDLEGSFNPNNLDSEPVTSHIKPGSQDRVDDKRNQHISGATNSTSDHSTSSKKIRWLDSLYTSFTLNFGGLAPKDSGTIESGEPHAIYLDSVRADTNPNKSTPFSQPNELLNERKDLSTVSDVLSKNDKFTRSWSTGNRSIPSSIILSSKNDNYATINPAHKYLAENDISSIQISSIQIDDSVDFTPTNRSHECMSHNQSREGFHRQERINNAFSNTQRRTRSLPRIECLTEQNDTNLSNRFASNPMLDISSVESTEIIAIPINEVTPIKPLDESMSFRQSCDLPDEQKEFPIVSDVCKNIEAFKKSWSRINVTIPPSLFELSKISSKNVDSSD